MTSLFDEISPGLPGIEQLRAMIDTGRRPAIGDSLDFQLVEVGEGSAAFEGIPGRHAYNPIGTVHSRLTATQGYTTLELKVSYHRPMTTETGLVRAAATLVSFGRRVAFAQATLTDAAGKVYATATSTLLIFER